MGGAYARLCEIHLNHGWDWGKMYVGSCGPLEEKQEINPLNITGSVVWEP